MGLRIGADKNFFEPYSADSSNIFLNSSNFIAPIFKGVILLTHILHFRLQALVVSINK